MRETVYERRLGSLTDSISCPRSHVYPILLTVFLLGGCCSSEDMRRAQVSDGTADNSDKPCPRSSAFLFPDYSITATAEHLLSLESIAGRESLRVSCGS